MATSRTDQNDAQKNTRTGTRVLLLDNIHSVATEALSEAGLTVETVDHSLSEDELADRVRSVDLLGVRSGTHVTERVLAGADRLLAVGAFCIGTNQIDLAGASRRGVAVFNAPFSNTRSVVELAIAEIVALTRRLTEKNDAMHAGRWEKSAAGSHEVRGRTLGIIGYGNIGAQLSVLAEDLGMSVCFYDVVDKLALGNARRCGSLGELLQVSDIVSIHVDGRPGNRQLFGERQFVRMRDDAIFLNLSRGFVVDQAALRGHLESGHLAGAAIDVFPDEPKRRGETFDSELRGMPNVILTPHIGGSTEEAQEDIGQFVAHKLIDYAAAGSTSLSVNLPELSLPQRTGTHRLVHMHRNTPGVLAEIDGLLAKHDVNIEGQHLGTRGEIGYVIVDVGSDYTEEMLDQLRDLPETVLLRVLS
ncbi:MAG: phosphoglycerate dehydrogenase [Streptosporangiaceae bacterium]